MEIARAGAVVETPVVEVSTHQLIEQLEAAVKNRRPDVSRLIGMLQNRCLTAEEPLHPHINKLVTIFIELSTHQRPMERYHLAQVLALWVHKSALCQPVEFDRIPDGDWQRIREMKGQHKLLDLYLDCLWGAYWRLCYPQDKLSKKEIAQLFGKAGVCSFKAAKGEYEPTVEYAKELRDRIRQIPPDWTHRASVYIQWGHELGRHKNLMVELEQLLDERLEADSPLMVAMAHALGTVAARRDLDFVSACDRLKTLACLGRHGKPRTDAFGDVRYHAWSLLFSLGPQCHYDNELTQQRNLPEKVPEVLTLLTQEHPTFPCTPLQSVPAEHFPTMDEKLLGEMRELRSQLQDYLVKMQDLLIQMQARQIAMLANQSKIMISLDSVHQKLRIFEPGGEQQLVLTFQPLVQCVVQMLVPTLIKPAPKPQKYYPSEYRSSPLHEAFINNIRYHERVCLSTRIIQFKTGADYKKIWIAASHASLKYQSALTKLWTNPIRSVRDARSTEERAISTVLIPFSYIINVATLPLQAIAYTFDRSLHNRAGRCNCASCRRSRETLFNRHVKPFHPELDNWKT